MKKILVVDDETISAITIGAFLEEEGFTVEVAGNAKEALKRAAQLKPDLLLSDWKLQDELDGVEVLRILQRDNPSMKAVLYTGMSIDELKRQAEGTVVSRFLDKPCGISELMEAIEEALQLMNTDAAQPGRITAAR